MSRSTRIAWYLCVLAFVLHSGFSFYTRSINSNWQNVPPPPTKDSAALFAIGDPQFAYRMFGIMIQNLGDTGGRVTPLYAYDFECNRESM